MFNIIFGHLINYRTWPFHKLAAEEAASTIPVDFSKTPIEAIFVFHDPRNWALDIQVICDVLQSGGIIGGPPVAQPTKHIDLIFSNPDLIWGSDFPRPRFGQGAFKTAFQAVYKVHKCFFFEELQAHAETGSNRFRISFRAIWQTYAWGT
jgi:hypothetical protein